MVEQMEQTNGKPDEPQVNPEEQSVEQGVFEDLFKTDDFFGAPEKESEQETGEQTEGKDARQKELDEKSYRYWQSVADKRANEIAKLQERLERIEQQQMQPQQPIQQPQPNTKPVESQEADFPPPPPRPQKPRNFSYSDAYADGSSESARYLEELEQWRSDIAEYNVLRQQYLEVQLANKLEQQEEIRRREESMKKAQLMQQRKMQALVDTLRNGYRATDEQIQGFIKEMSSRSSISIDNLWKLYAIQHGIPLPTNQPQPQTQEIKQPSQDFLQMQTAQQVPTPMGIIPNTGNEAGNKKPEDIIMDRMIAMEKAENPFG